MLPAVMRRLVAPRSSKLLPCLKLGLEPGQSRLGNDDEDGFSTLVTMGSKVDLEIGLLAASEPVCPSEPVCLP